MFKNSLKDNNETLNEIKQIIDELGSSDEGLTIENDDAANQYSGISTLHELWQNFTYQTYYIKNYSINKK
jgi:hypothetical protein